eukprot:scaffold10285_cov74-Cyclotella_meneghiniana.AAC.5
MSSSCLKPLKLKIYSITEQKDIVHKLIPVAEIDKKISIQEFIRAKSKCPGAKITSIKSGEECDCLSLLDSPMDVFFECISDESLKKMTVEIVVVKVEQELSTEVAADVPTKQSGSDVDDDDETVPLEEEERSGNVVKREIQQIEDSPPAPKRVKPSSEGNAIVPEHVPAMVTPAAKKTDDNMVQVIEDEDAWKILVSKFGFLLVHGRYCVPSTPSVKFDTIEELRKDLCKYGIPELGLKGATEEEVLAIETWVRFANVRNFKGEVNRCIWQDMKFMTAWSAMGLKYSGGNYTVPIHDPSTGERKIIKFRNNSCVEVENYFARFGVFVDLEGKEIDDEMLMKIDLFFSNQPMDSQGVAEVVNTL